MSLLLLPTYRTQQQREPKSVILYWATVYPATILLLHTKKITDIWEHNLTHTFFWYFTFKQNIVNPKIKVHSPKVWQISQEIAVLQTEVCLFHVSNLGVIANYISRTEG